MNHTPFDYPLPRSSDEQKVELEKQVEEMQKHLEDFNKLYNFTKSAVMEIFPKFEILLSKMSLLVAIAHGVCSERIVNTAKPDEMEVDRDSKEKGDSNHSIFSVPSDSSDSFTSLEHKTSQSSTKKSKLSSRNSGITTENEHASYRCQAGPSTERYRTEALTPYPNENVENKTKNSANNKEIPEIFIIKEPEISLIKIKKSETPLIIKQEISKDRPVDTCKSSLSNEQISPFLEMRRKWSVSQKTGAVSQKMGAVSQNKGAVSQNKGAVSQKMGAVSQNKGAVSQNKGAVSQKKGAVVNQRTGAATQSRDLQFYPSEQQDEAKNLYDSDNEAVKIALDMTKGVLSRKDLNSYLYISVDVEDPVQLAKISFTKDIKQLYFQLVKFAFHLKTENDRLQEEQGKRLQIDRKLEERLQTIIAAFRRTI